jgi:alkaline phosphatase D
MPRWPFLDSRRMLMLDLAQLPEAIRGEGGVSRRLFLAYGAALSSIPLLGRATRAERSTSFASNPFSLGVASGDPAADGMVLWTRLAPRPLDPDGGMPAEPVGVRWEIAEDETFSTVLRQGTASAAPELAHSVHVELAGLAPDRWYFYRFHAGDATSPVGRTRTLPARDAAAQQLKFAFASCQHYETGLFTAYQYMAQDDLDLVFHLGDYIYEDGGRDGHVRRHANAEIIELGDYRVRYSQYRSDPLLQAMHAQCPWLVTWDDHEVDNNYAGSISEKPDVSPEQLLARRAAAYQAYYEMMPLRARSLPRGPDMQLYRRGSFGKLAEFFVLDTRQYRCDQPNDAKRSPLDETTMLPGNSLLGAAQREWLQSGLVDSPGTWNILAQQVMMGLVGFRNREAKPLVFSMDQWPSAALERIQLVQMMADRRVSNPVVLTGDIHSNWVNNLRVDDRRPETPVVATEFAGTSISSGGNGADRIRSHDELLADNPCVQFHNAERGYCRCTVTPGQWTSEYIVIDDITRPGGKATKRAAFVVEAGRPGAQRA